VFAALRSFDWEPARIASLARQVFVEENPLGDYTLPLVSLLRGRRLSRVMRRHFEVAIEDLPLPFFCVSSHLERGEAIVHERGPLWRAIRASVALPGVLPPAVIDGHLAVDGALLNNLPVDLMKERPVGRVIGVDLSQTRCALPWNTTRFRVRSHCSRVAFAVPAQKTSSEHHLPDDEGVARFELRAQPRDACQADLMLAPGGAFGPADAGAFDEIVTVGYETREAPGFLEAAAQRDPPHAPAPNQERRPSRDQGSPRAGAGCTRRADRVRVR
jgi:predicted acylesterase/phospholipase RssA